MDFLTLARERFSVLEYEYRDVEAEKLEKILAAALAAPTACNLQPQRIVLIDAEKKRQKLNDAVPGGHFAPAAFLVCYDSRACWVRPQDGKSSGEIDASIAATHMMLEATDLGLGSIWVMSWDVDILFSCEKFLQYTSLPSIKKLLFTKNVLGRQQFVVV